MSDKFEGFYKKQISCEQYALSYNSRDMEIIRNHYERSKANMKEAWDHQQQRINKLETEKNALAIELTAQVEKIDKLESLLKEAVELVENSGAIETLDFENNPLIKKLRGEE